MKFIVTVLLCYCVSVFLCLLFAAGLIAQPEKIEFKKSEPKKPKATLSLAKEDADGNITDNVRIFSPKDIPILCYVDLKTAKPVAVKLNFVAVKVKGIRPNSRIISVSYKTKNGEDSVTFTGKPEKVWLAGAYRVDIYLDGKLAMSETFSVEKPKSKTK